MKRLSALLFCFAIAGDGGTTSQPDAGADAGPAAPDSAVPIECEFPAAMIAGSAETDALADAPARCGASAYTWLRDGEVGQVVSVESADRYTPMLLTALAEGAGVVLPRAPGEPTSVRTIRYRTQDRGALVEATALVAVPEGEAGRARDVLLFLHGTSGFRPGCGGSDESGNRILMALLASYGFIVVAPDYLGLESGAETYGALHPYLVGEATAIASIDAVRAAAALAPSDRGDTCVAPRVATLGGSQGGHAALWVDRLMPYYARELTHVGVVATVPPANLLAQITRAVLAPVDATANTAAFYGAASSWYGYGDRLDEVFTAPYDVDVAAALAAACSPGDLLPATLEELFTSEVLSAAGGGTFADLAPWGCMAAENGLTSTSIARISVDASSYGILFVTGEVDPLVDTPTERASFQTLCDAGIPMQYLECEGASHGATTAWALPEILRFVEARFAGEAFVPPSSCVPPAASRCEATPAD